jgi:cytidylate kinase
VEFDEVVDAQAERDRRDAERHDGPMIPAEDALILDSTGCSLDEVLERMEAEVRRCTPASVGSSTNRAIG